MSEQDKEAAWNEIDCAYALGSAEYGFQKSLFTRGFDAGYNAAMSKTEENMSDKTELLNDIDVLRSYYSPDTPEHSTLKRAWEAINADGWRRIEGPESLPKEEGTYIAQTLESNKYTAHWIAEFYDGDVGPAFYIRGDEPLEDPSTKVVRWMPIPPFTE